MSSGSRHHPLAFALFALALAGLFGLIAWDLFERVAQALQWSLG